MSRDTVSRITDAIVADMEAWQSRPLDAVYAVVLIGAIAVKVRDTQVANRPVYVAIGVNLDGERDVLITCCDGLKGLPDALRTIWADTTVQTCVVHLGRNSLRYLDSGGAPG